MHYVLYNNACVEKKVSSVEGGEVLLKVDEAETTEVSWVTRPDNYHIARTFPNGDIYIRGDKYKGKLFGESGGSLRIINLTRDDQGIYKANQRMRENHQCVEFILTVYKQVTADDLQISHAVSGHERCSMNLTCAVRRSDLNVTWTSSDGDITGDGNVVSVHNPQVNVTYTCTAWNPGTNSSKSVTPWTYCNIEKTPRRIRADYTMENIGRLILSGCILVLASCLFTCHLKTERDITSNV